MNTEKMQRWLSRLLSGFGLIVVLYIAVLLLVSVIRFADSRAFVWDAGLYWGVGRSILNGLTPYRDLYENKPPGIFVLSALSLNILGTNYLGNILGALSLLVMPAAAWIGLRSNRTFSLHFPIVLSVLIAGGVWSLFMAENVGPWQTELFGSLFAALYAVLLFFPHSRWRTAGLSVALACATGFKEPFLFACAAAALVVAGRPRDFIQLFVVPAFFALCMGFLTMYLTGYLSAYVDIYLPSVIGYRGERYGSFLMRGLRVDKHALILFRLSLAFLPAFILSIFTLCRASVLRIVALLYALYLAMLAVGLPGDYQSHHFGFFTPFFMAVIIASHRYVASTWARPSVKRLGMVIIFLWILTGATVHWPHDYRQSLQDIRDVKQASASLDDVLDRCDVDRYLQVNPGVNKLPLFAYTRHSPLNHSLFLQIDDAIQYGQPFLDESVRRLSEAQIIAFPLGKFTPNNDIGVSMISYITQSFTQSVPDCAHPLPPTPGFTLLFRTNPEPFDPEISVIDAR